MAEINNEEDMLANEEDLFGPTQPLAPLSPLRINDDYAGNNNVNEGGATGILHDFHGGYIAEGVNGDGKTIEKEKKPRKPHTNLNVERIIGKSGLRKIPNVFKGVKFRGKGREKEDLAFLLEKLEHWAHLMTPRRQFIDVVERLEFLGAKKIVRQHSVAVKRGDTLEEILGNEEEEEGEKDGNRENVENDGNNAPNQTNINKDNTTNNKKDDIEMLLNDGFDDLAFDLDAV